MFKIDEPKYCSEIISVRITAEQLEWLAATSDNSQYSISAVIRQLIDNQIHTEAVLEAEGKLAEQNSCKDRLVEEEND